MANQRDKSKRLVGFFATPEEKAAIQAAANSRGISVAELLRGIALGTLKPEAPGADIESERRSAAKKKPK